MPLIDYLIAFASERMFAIVLPYILPFMSLGVAISSFGSVLRAPPQTGFLNILLLYVGEFTILMLKQRGSP